MPPFVDLPQIIEAAVAVYGKVFANNPQRQHFVHYLTGLMVARRKSVTSISADFLVASDPSCLNRFLTEAPWDIKELNGLRLANHQQDVTTRYHERGVIPIDNVLIHHSGDCIDDVGWFWDHAEERHVLAHDYIIANYVTPYGKHYPVDFRRFVKADRCAELQQPHQTHTQLTAELIDFVCQEKIPGTFTFDRYFACAEILNHIHGKELEPGRPRAYVAALKANRNVQYRGKVYSASGMAANIPPSARKPVRTPSGDQWYFTCVITIPKVDHKVRILLIWDNRDAAEPRLILVTNQLGWEVNRIVEVYRCRWTGTETFHRDGQQHLGMGSCQLRNGQGQTRHMYLVMVAYSLLMNQLDSSHSYGWSFGRLKTIGQACRAVIQDLTRKTIQWVVHQAQVEHWSTTEILNHLRLNTLVA